MQKVLLVIAILLPLSVCAQSAAKPEVDSRSAFEIILAKVRSAQAQTLKTWVPNPKTDSALVRRIENANNVLLNIKTRKSLIAFLLEPPDLFVAYEEPLRLQWVQILQNEQIAGALERKQVPLRASKQIILQ